MYYDAVKILDNRGYLRKIVINVDGEEFILDKKGSCILSCS